MKIVKTKRNKQMLKDYLFNDKGISQLADEHGIRQPTAHEIIHREYDKYINNKDTYFQEESI